MERPIEYFRCGTLETWEKARSEYPKHYRVVPATVYVSATGLCLVTSQEWCDWLLGIREDVPLAELNVDRSTTL